MDNTRSTLSFTKKIILFILIMAEIDILCSYVLAFLGMPEIAQELSSQVVTVCLGSIGFYCVKALIENLSKYGGLFGVNEVVLEQTEDEEDYSDEEEEVPYLDEP